MALFIDVECYKNYFLFCAKNDKTSRVTKIPMHEGCELKKDLLQKIMANETTISFNGNKYDLLIIGGALKGWSCEKLHELSNEIIQSDKNTYQILSDNNLRLPTYNHIDLIERQIIKQGDVVEMRNAAMRENELHLSGFSEIKKSLL